MSQPVDPTRPDPARLLREYREGLTPPAGSKDAAWVALAASTSAPPSGWTLATKIVSGLAIGVAVGGGLFLALGGTEPPRARAPERITPPVVEAPVAPVAAAVVEPAFEVAPALARPPLEEIRLVREAEHEPEAEPEVAVPPGSTLAEEVRLLREAEELFVLDPGAALEVLEEHHTRFPSGALASQRDVRRVGALCRLGRRDEARALAGELATASPALTDRLERACPSD